MADNVPENLRAWAARQRAAAVALAHTWAGKLEAEVKRDGPWTDRTGNARAGLIGRAALEGNTVYMRVAHTMEYGPSLELARDGKHAVLKPVRDRNADAVRRDFRRLWE